MTDYSALQKTMKNFEPFANLWNTASNWVKWQSEWNDGPFINLDPEEMEKDLSGAQRTMFKLVKTFDGVAGSALPLDRTAKHGVADHCCQRTLLLALRTCKMQ